MIVQVYRNLKTRTFSVRAKGGTVLGHYEEVILAEPVFKVQPAGQRRVQRTHQKCVHAYIEGEWLEDIESVVDFVDGITDTQVTYSPYRDTPSFTLVDSGAPVHRAAVAYCTGGREVWVADAH